MRRRRYPSWETFELVKIYTKVIPRKYKNKTPYAYLKHLVPISVNYNQDIVGFLKVPLDEKIWIEGETLHLILTKKQRSLVALNGLSGL